MPRSWLCICGHETYRHAMHREVSTRLWLPGACYVEGCNCERCFSEAEQAEALAELSDRTASR